MTTEPITKSDDFFSDRFQSNQKGNPYFNLKKVGDKCRGFLVRRSDRPDQNNEGTVQRVYTIVIPDGEEYPATINATEGDTTLKGGDLMDVYGRLPRDQEDGSRLKVTPGAEEAMLGTLVGFKFTEERASKTNAKYKAKIMQAFVDQKSKRPDLVEKHGGFQMEAASGEGLPF